MRRLIVILSALAAVLMLCQAAYAQQPQPQVTQQKIAERIAEWTGALNRAEDRLKAGDLTLRGLAGIRETVAGVEKEVSAARGPMREEVERLRKLIDALGPAPKEGEQPESDDISAQRRELNASLAEADGQLKQLELLLERSRGLLSRIGVAEGAALGDKLLAQTPSLLAPETWASSADEFVTLGGLTGKALSYWYGSSQVGDAIASGYFAFALIAVIAAAVLGWVVRRWLIRRFGRNPAIGQPNYRMRVLAALAEGAARVAIPILVAVVAYAVLKGGGLLFGLFEHMVFGFVVAVVLFSVLYGWPRAMLSPAIPQWRLAMLGDNAARLWYVYAVLLAAISALDMLFIIPATELQPSQVLLNTYNFLTNSAYALVFFLMAADKRLWRTPVQEMRARAAAGEDVAAPEEEAIPRSRWWLLGRVLVAGVALAIPVAALAGYGVLSDFIARRLLATAAVLLVAVILHGLLRDLVAIFTREADREPDNGEPVSPFYVWSVLFLDIGLVLAMAFVIVPLWGGQWDSIFERIGWSLTGFEIGGRVFSITDVIAGMAVFVIVLALVRSLQHFVNRRILQHTRIDTGVRHALTTGIGYVGLVIAGLVAVTTAGIDLSGLALIAGALSVGIGFGLQSVVNNFVSGIILLAERPIKVGDWVEVGQYQGIVQRVSVRSTEIKTFSRASVIVPNSELISTSVVNWMHKDRSGRIEIPVGVAYGSDVEKVREALLRCAAEHASVQKTPEPYVLFMDFGDSALLFELRCFVADVDSRLSITSELRFAIDAAFRAEGITIPFPQRDLHIKDVAGLAGAAAQPSSRRRRRKPGGADDDPGEADGEAGGNGEA